MISPAIASRLPLIAALCALAACSQSGDASGGAANVTSEPAAATDNIAAPPTPAPAEPAPIPSPSGIASGETVGGDGSLIRLAALTGKDLAGAKLDGELACGFEQGRDATLLLARGDVGSKERAWGVIKIVDTVEPVSAPGGYAGMLRGGTFASKGMTVRIAVTGPATGGGESPSRPATLTALRADGASRVVRGSWTCGP